MCLVLEHHTNIASMQGLHTRCTKYVFFDDDERGALVVQCIRCENCAAVKKSAGSPRTGWGMWLDMGGGRERV